MILFSVKKAECKIVSSHLLQPFKVGLIGRQEPNGNKKGTIDMDEQLACG
jgi:hypothetical protein